MNEPKKEIGGPTTFGPDCLSEFQNIASNFTLFIINVKLLDILPPNFLEVLLKHAYIFVQNLFENRRK